MLGVYLPTVLSMDADEHVLCMVDPGDYRGELLLTFENGKAARIPVSAYETKTNRRRLTGAYSDKSPLVAVLPLYAGSEVVLFASDGARCSSRRRPCRSRPRARRRASPSWR